MRMVRVDRLKPNPRNARVHSEAQVDLIAGLIDRYGWTRPILVDVERTVVAGHGALRAAIKRGMTHVPVVELSGLTPQQAREYMLADNKSAELSTWDDELLKLEVGELVALNADLPALGFTTEELDDILAPPAPSGGPSTSVSNDDANAAWRMWARELHDQIRALQAAGLAPFSGITKGYATLRFLEALHDGAEYPRHCSLAFHRHQVDVAAGSATSLLNGLNLVAIGEIKAERLRFVGGDEMDPRKFASGALPFASARMPLDFPASLARDLINEFAGKAGRVLDPCAGWGGRVVGFLLSKAAEYYGVEVSPQSCEGLGDIIAAFAPYTRGKNATIACSPFEDVELGDGGGPYDFALTSPPYFDVEKYIGGDQSHSRYPNYPEWRDGFYRTLIGKTAGALRAGGTFALQIGSQRYPLMDDGRSIAKSFGLTVAGTRETDMYNGQTQTEGERAECILILRKP